MLTERTAAILKDKMVVTYSPEPQQNCEEGFNIDGGSVIIVDTESSDEDDHIGNGSHALGTDQFAYELLPQEVPLVGTSENNNVSDLLGSIAVNTSANPVRDNETCGDISASPPERSKIRSDIEINCDEVRAAMRNVTLPPSSFPPWAESIPESQWTQFVFGRITHSDVQLNLDNNLPPTDS